MTPSDVGRYTGRVGRIMLLLATLGAAAGCGDSTGPGGQPLVIKPAPSAGDWQHGRAGVELPNPLRVVVTRGGRPVAGVAVQWTTSDGEINGGGPTDADGVAVARWMLPRRQFYGLVAQAATGSDSVTKPVTFHAAAEYPALEVVSGDEQAVDAGEPLPESLRVRVTWRGQPLAGEAIHWSENVEPQGDRTGADGTAAAIWRLGGEPGVKHAWARLDDDGPQVWLWATVRCRSGAQCATPGQFAYTSNDGVYVSQLDGSDARLVAANAAMPAWSPAGDQLAFVRTLVVGNEFRWQVCVARPDGTGRRCASGDGLGVIAGGPSWSPDGSQVAFSARSQDCSRQPCSLTTYSGLLVLEVATMKVAKIATHPMKAVSWSPDGRRIAFVGTAGELGMVNPDGSGLGYLKPSMGPFVPFDVAWSPDGRKVAVAVSNEMECSWICDTAIATVAADGTGFRVIALGSAREHEWVGSPGWSPDGAYATFTLRGWETLFSAAVPVTEGPTKLLVNGGELSWRR